MPLSSQQRVETGSGPPPGPGFFMLNGLVVPVKFALVPIAHANRDHSEWPLTWSHVAMVPMVPMVPVFFEGYT